MPEARKHHYLPVCLLQGFATPPSDDGRLFVLDHARKKVFGASPRSCGYQRDFNRVDAETHPNPLVIEEFYANMESHCAPVLEHVRRTGRVGSKTSWEWIHIFVAIQSVRTPHFRRWLEGKHFQILEERISQYARSKASRRRFQAIQRKAGLPEESWSPEGFLSRLKSGDFSTTTDDNWKMAISNEIALLGARLLGLRNWFVAEFEETMEPLILADAAVAFLPVGSSLPKSVGLMQRSTVLLLPVSPRRALVGAFPEVYPTVRRGLPALTVNTASFALSMEQCFGTTDDFSIDDPDRGISTWGVFCAEGKFPKLAVDWGDLADVYAGRTTTESFKEHEPLLQQIAAEGKRLTGTTPIRGKRPRPS